MISVIGNWCTMFAIMESKFPHWLAEKMTSAGLNQSQLAKRSHIDQAAISRLLAGKTSPNATTYSERISALEQRISETRQNLEVEGRLKERHEARRLGLSAVVEVLRASSEFITKAPAQTVNQSLRTLIERVELNEAGEMKIVYR
jgi:transcriptional regulator with XRE-family HTH domain